MDSDFRQLGLDWLTKSVEQRYSYNFTVARQTNHSISAGYSVRSAATLSA